MTRYCTYGTTHISEYKNPLINVAMISYAKPQVINTSATIEIDAGKYENIFIPSVLVTSLEFNSSDLKHEANEYFNKYCQTIPFDVIKHRHSEAWDYIWQNGMFNFLKNKGNKNNKKMK